MDTKYLNNLLSVMNYYKLSNKDNNETTTTNNPIQTLQDIIRSSLKECFQLQNTNDDNWIYYLIRNKEDLEIFNKNDYFKIIDEVEELLDIPSKIQHYYNYLLNIDNCEQKKLEEPLRKRQRRSTSSTNTILHVNDDVWIPLLGYVTTEIVYQIAQRSCVETKWSDVLNKTIKVINFNNDIITHGTHKIKCGCKLWMLNHIQHRLYFLEESLDIDIVAVPVSTRGYYNYMKIPLNGMKCIHSYHNLIIKTIFQCWDRMNVLKKKQLPFEEKGDIACITNQLFYSMYCYMDHLNTLQLQEMKYKPGITNEKEFLWWLLYNVEIYLRKEPNISNTDYSDACRKLNIIQVIPNFTNKEMQQDALQYGWKRLVQEVYMKVYKKENGIIIRKIQMFTFGKKCMLDFLFNDVGDVKEILKFIYPSDKELAIFYACQLLGLDGMSDARARDIMNSNEYCFRPGGREKVERAIIQQEKDDEKKLLYDSSELNDDVEMEDVNEEEEVVEEVYESKEEQMEDHVDDQDDEEESIIEINDDDEEETIPMKETSDATVEEPSSIAPSFYEESDEQPMKEEDRHRHHHQQHNIDQHSTTTANKSIDSQEIIRMQEMDNAEVRCDDTTAAVATSDGETHGFFSGEEDETHDTQRTHNIARSGEKESIVEPNNTPLTIHLKEEKAYEADIEMEDKKRGRLAVTFASDHHHVLSNKRDHMGDDEESKEKAYEADIEQTQRRINAPGTTNVVLMQHTPPSDQHHQPPSSSSSISSLHHHMPSSTPITISSPRKPPNPTATLADAANQIWLAAQHSSSVDTATLADAAKDNNNLSSNKKNSLDSNNNKIHQSPKGGPNSGGGATTTPEQKKLIQQPIKKDSMIEGVLSDKIPTSSPSSKQQKQQTTTNTTMHREEEKAYEADSEMDEKERQKFLSHHSNSMHCTNHPHSQHTNQHNHHHQLEDQSSFTDISTRANRFEEELHDGDITTEGNRSPKSSPFHNNTNTTNTPTDGQQYHGTPQDDDDHHHDDLVVAHREMAPPPAVVRLSTSSRQLSLSPFQQQQQQQQLASSPVTRSHEEETTRNKSTSVDDHSTTATHNYNPKSSDEEHDDDDDDDEQDEKLPHNDDDHKMAKEDDDIIKNTDDEQDHEQDKKLPHEDDYKMMIEDIDNIKHSGDEQDDEQDKKLPHEDDHKMAKEDDYNIKNTDDEQDDEQDKKLPHEEDDHKMAIADNNIKNTDDEQDDEQDKKLPHEEDDHKMATADNNNTKHPDDDTEEQDKKMPSKDDQNTAEAHSNKIKHTDDDDEQEEDNKKEISIAAEELPSSSGNNDVPGDAIEKIEAAAAAAKTPSPSVDEGKIQSTKDETDEISQKPSATTALKTEDTDTEKEKQETPAKEEKPEKEVTKLTRSSSRLRTRASNRESIESVVSGVSSVETAEKKGTSSQPSTPIRRSRRKRTSVGYSTDESGAPPPSTTPATATRRGRLPKIKEDSPQPMPSPPRATRKSARKSVASKRKSVSTKEEAVKKQKRRKTRG